MIKHLKKRIKDNRRDYQISRSFKNSKIIFSSGMGRSGSTLLFNMLRLSLCEHYRNENVSAFWIGDHSDHTCREATLIKTHIMNKRRSSMAHRAFYSYRDIRDCLVSWSQKNKKRPEISLAAKWIEQYRFAKESSAVMINYENLTQNQNEAIESIICELNLNAAPENIAKAIPGRNSPNDTSSKYSPTTLLHSNHFTGTTTDQWKETLEEEMITYLKNECEWWFEDSGYSW